MSTVAYKNREKLLSFLPKNTKANSNTNSNTNTNTNTNTDTNYSRSTTTTNSNDNDANYNNKSNDRFDTRNGANANGNTNDDTAYNPTPVPGASLAIAGSIRQLKGSTDSRDISRNPSHDDDEEDDDDDKNSKKGWASMALYNTVPEAYMQTDVNILREKMASFSGTNR
jgi:hypothetical protein